ncbi:uncharacterized protein VTP21DRAFT_5054 [Calcarisporiella thermophila]|uniref:uncharacterized protein n=1 Tax=Calcarisporiella thermophila TaxID=911321 RepID=UPI003742EA30
MKEIYITIPEESTPHIILVNERTPLTNAGTKQPKYAPTTSETNRTPNPYALILLFLFAFIYPLLMRTISERREDHSVESCVPKFPWHGPKNLQFNQTRFKMKIMDYHNSSYEVKVVQSFERKGNIQLDIKLSESLVGNFVGFKISESNEKYELSLFRPLPQNPKLCLHGKITITLPIYIEAVDIQTLSFHHPLNHELSGLKVGEKVEIRTTVGNISFKDVAAPNILASSNFGNITGHATIGELLHLDAVRGMFDMGTRISSSKEVEIKANALGISQMRLLQEEFQGKFNISGIYGPAIVEAPGAEDLIHLQESDQLHIAGYFGKLTGSTVRLNALLGASLKII